MAPHTTTEMREHMVLWHSELGKTNSEIAALSGCSEWTVREVLWLHREYGVVRNSYAQPHGHHCSLATADLNYLSSILDANPCLYLDELQSRLATDRDVDVSISTLSHAVRNLALSCKCVLKAALERNKLLRTMWQAEYGDIPADYFVWLTNQA